MTGQAEIIKLSKFNEAIKLKILVYFLREREITKYALSYIGI